MMRKWLIWFLALSLLATAGCAGPNEKDKPEEDERVPQTDQTMFTDRDKETQYPQTNSVRIQLKGDTATASSNSVSIDGTTVTITAEGTYILSGSLESGSIIVDADEKDKPQLVFEGVTIYSNASAIDIQTADKVFITLAEGTENHLSGGSEGAVYSKQDLTFNGPGSLTVASTAGYAITCKDDLVFTGGNYQIQSASHGLDANDSIRITGATSMTLDAGKDGIHCENSDDAELGFVYIENGTLNITAQGDGISAGAYARVLDGRFNILAGGGNANSIKEHSDSFGGFPGGGGGRPPRPREVQSTTTEASTSMKGLKAVGDITLEGGSFLMDTADDAIHSNAAITVTGGSFELSSGDDAFHADETLTIDAGVLNVKTSYEGLEAHKVYVCGGELEIHAKDDGINAAGGQDDSGAGGRDGMFGGGRPGGPMGGGSSDGEIGISDGQLKIYSSGDGMDANGSITISGGNIYVNNPTSGDTSVMDSDTGAVITGGSFISAGASTMMAQSFTSASTQGVIAGTVGAQKAGTLISVMDLAGNTVISYETEYDFVLVILSTPALKKGETYTLTVGGLSHTVQAA